MNKTIEFFKEICAVPHGSYNIDAISDYLVKFAEDRNLNVVRDEVKNVIITKSASEGFENRPGVILQGHMDMVAVKEDDCTKDLTKEGLDLEEKDGYLYAKGTSLGGDDGIAVAMALSILDDDSLKHPSLRCIFTVNEEVGMDGANAMDMSDVSEKYLINIDSEEEGVITTSCAGGVCLSSNLPVNREIPLYGNLYRIEISGLKGGHSGTMIHLHRGNACKLLGELLSKLLEKGNVNLLEIGGGEKDNAIPKSATMTLATDMDEELFEKTIVEYDGYVCNKYTGIEDNIEVKVTPLTYDREDCKLIGDETRTIAEILSEIPDGVVSVCEGIDLVETSLNLGIMKSEDSGFRTDYLIRSSVDAKKEELKEQIGKRLALKGCELALSGDYPGWKFNPASKLTEVASESFEELYGYKPVVTGVHAGLECGILLSKKSDLDCISVGPNILNIHTYNEKLDLESTDRTYEFLIKVLQKIQ